MKHASAAAIEQERLAGWRKLDAGNIDSALSTFRQVLDRVPGDAESLTGIASALRQQGKLRDAILSCDAALRTNPQYAAAWLERAFVLTAGGSTDAAFDNYARAAALDPVNADALAGMASISARRGDSQLARETAARALRIAPGNAIATFALATVEIDQKESASAATRLKQLISTLPEPSPERSVANNLLGDACDRQNFVADAYAAYCAGKQDFAAIHASQFAARDQTHRAFVEGIAAGVGKISDTGSWALAENRSPVGVANHVFLIGYPRSGTTLVENVLASLPDVTALEERPTLRDADRQFLTDSEGIARLATLDAAAGAQLQQAYWDKVAASRAMPPDNGTFVDMDPLKGTRLPIIARLFPQAKVVIMRRDPRDVVWSCFHTNFALTNAALEFTTLETAALHYDATMRLIELCLERLPVNAYELRYDRLVTDFDGATQDLCAFIGLPWSPDMRHFDRTAKSRGVATASASQVRKPLYNGTKQWERYREYMMPVLPILQPWVDRFGFES